ncbi:MAG TPA: hypothetical protein VG317_13000 [Pseudonocardiaceae bacterium]|nr:hypothetical protein [Pseudonocardiaceae bacterium]
MLVLWFRAAIISFLFFLFFLFIWLLTSASALAASSGSGYSDGSDSGASVSYILLYVAFIGSAVLFWVIFLASRWQEPIGEWRTLLADRAPAAASTYSQIVGRLRDRAMPIYWYTRRTPSGFGTVGNRLVLVDGHYEVHVSVFQYGTSLYLGWMMWRSRRGVHLVGRFIVDLLQGMMGRLDPVDLMLRTERPRAMREAVHAVCREGLHVAVEQIEVPDGYGFPQGMPPLENYPGVSAPMPSAAMPSTAPPPTVSPQ